MSTPMSGLHAVSALHLGAQGGTAGNLPLRSQGGPGAYARVKRDDAPLLVRLRALGWAALWLGLSCYLTLSALSLARLGVPYDAPGGNPLVKIHPGSYLLVLALVFALAGRGHPMAVFISRLRQMPLVAVYLGCMVFIAVWSVWRNGTSGAAFIVDSLWMPGVLLWVLSLYGPHKHRQLLVWCMLLLALNALVALGEYALKTPLVSRYPLESDLVADAGFFRSSALLGHPLANALITVTLMPAAVLLPTRLGLRWIVLALLCLALLAFGSRVALGVAVGVYASAGLLVLLYKAVHGRFSYLQLTGGVLALVLVVAAGAGVVMVSGLGERIFKHLVWDNSANVRLVVWNALDYLDDLDWWLGVSPQRIDDIAGRIGLDVRYEAIENFWIVLLMQFGLVGFIPFLVGLACGLAHVWRAAAPPLRLAMPVFFVVASGANTLASKTVGLTLLFMAMVASGAWVAHRPSQMPSRRQGLHKGAA